MIIYDSDGLPIISIDTPEDLEEAKKALKPPLSDNQIELALSKYLGPIGTLKFMSSLSKRERTLFFSDPPRKRGVAITMASASAVYGISTHVLTKELTNAFINSSEASSGIGFLAGIFATVVALKYQSGIHLRELIYGLDK